MNVGLQNLNRTLFAGMGGGMMKSTKDKMERQEKCNSQVSFFEQQKENLKNMTCSSLEDIARKLEMFHSYEDQIAAAKQAYNNSQMGAVLDEARERGEKIAEAAEKAAPKTPEERSKELAEEAAGTEEESKGLLSEIMEEMEEMIEEMTEELEEELTEELTEQTGEIAEELTGEIVEERTGGITEELTKGAGEIIADSSLTIDSAIDRLKEQKDLKEQEEDLNAWIISAVDDKWREYRHFDYRI